MRTILSIILIILTPLFWVAETKAQMAEPACPSITIHRTRANNPTGVTEDSSFVCPGEEVTFKAVIVGIDPEEKTAYNWKLSAGTIISGQGTSTIRVSTVDAIGKAVTATVEVGDIFKLMAECNRAASTTIEVALCCLAPSARKFDEYSEVSWAKEKAHLPNLGIQLQQESGAAAYVIIYGPRRVAQHLERVRKFLVEKSRIDPERIKLKNGGYNKKTKVELWVAPTGATPPQPAPNF